MSSLERFRINTPKVASEIIDGEVVIINLDSGNYYSMNEVGADIWDFIKSGAHRGEMIEGIINRYNGDRVEIENSVTRLMAELQQEDLIVPDQEEKTKGVKELDMQVENRPRAEKISFEAPNLQKYTDMQDLLLLDPIHEVDETGWPTTKPNPSN